MDTPDQEVTITFSRESAKALLAAEHLVQEIYTPLGVAWFDLFQQLHKQVAMPASTT